MSHNISATASHSRPLEEDQERLDDFIFSTPATQRYVGFLDDFSHNDLAHGFQRACERVKFLREERSRLKEELLRLRHKSGPFNDNETLGASITKTVCGTNGGWMLQSSDSKELIKWIMDSCEIMDELILEIEDLNGRIGHERARQEIGM